MSKFRAIGVGSPFGADRVGWLAVAWLSRQQFPELKKVDFIATDRPGVNLLSQMRGAEAVFIIDALASGHQGRIRELAPEQLATERAGISNHGFGVAEALALGRILGDLPPRLVLLGIECPQPEGEPCFDREALLTIVLERLRNGG